MPADHNALVRYAFTRDQSSIYFRKEDGDFDKISCHENKSTSNLAAVKASTSPNLVKVAIVVSIVVVGLAVVAGAIAVALVFSTKDDGDKNNTDRQTSETTSPSFSGVSTADSTTESSGLSTSKTTSSKTGLQTTAATTAATTSTTVSGGSTAAPTDIQTTATTSTSVSGDSTAAPTVPSSSSWGEWTECTVTCGQGIHTRYRSCNSTASDCDYVQTDVCEESVCPVIGRWVTWSQWGSCNTTCGGGIQSRTRSCSKINLSDLDCVGENLQRRVCNDWKCPDCSQKCNVGTLNSDCTACVCNDRIVTGRIRSLETGISIGNAAVYDSATPTSILALSNATGYFVLTTKCIQSEILITKEGFVDKKIIISGSYIETEMVKTVLPFLIQSPLPKVRLTGENVTFCCEAEGNPNITYYEWFKDSVLIDTEENVNLSKILLTALSTDDTGYYSCRANSDVGAVLSTPVKLVIRENPAEFCKDALQQKQIMLPSDCIQPNSNSSLYEVGECNPKSCRSSYSEDTEQCTDDVNSCCSAAETTIETVNCKNYSLEVIVVKSCDCGQCYQEERLLISGIVTDFQFGSPLSFYKVLVNGKLKTITDFNGQYQFFTSKYETKLTVTVEDKSYEYLPTTKVINILNSEGGRLRIDLKMLKPADPVILDSSKENILYAGNMSNVTSPKIELKLPANSFYYPNGSVYSGLFHAMLTYLDPSSISDFEVIPGVFQYTTDEGELGNLDTLGVFNLYVEDTFGQKLEISNPVDAYIPYEVGEYETYKNFKLWTLNSQTGIWEDTTNRQLFKRQVRSKRDTAKLLIGQFTGISSALWYNYDEVYQISRNLCYFKICLFHDAPLTKKQKYPPRTIRLNIYIKRGNVLRAIKYFINNPEHHIIETVCDGDQALIIAETLDEYSLSRKLYVAKPSASNFNNFQIASDAQSLSIKLSPTGPFHSDRSFNDGSCLNYYYWQSDEWIHKNTILGPDTIACGTESADYYTYWYPYSISNVAYSACFVKVRVYLASFVTFSRSDTVTIRVMSSVQHKTQPTNTIIGIFERKIDLNANRDVTKCIDYRCSGPSDPCDGYTYITNVKVIIEHSRSDVSFTVVQKSKNIDSFVSSTDSFEFSAKYVPGSTDHGIYSSSKGTINMARDSAMNFCLTTQVERGNVLPHEGLAVTFEGNLG